MMTGAVVVTYNPQIGDLQSLMQNIEHAVNSVIIVDNGSNNISEIEILASKYPLVKVLKLEENKGIGYAQNQGIKFVFSHPDIDRVILFDHDSHPDKEMIIKLNYEYDNLIRQKIKVASVGPVYIDPRSGTLYPVTSFSGFKLKKIFPKAEETIPIETSFLIASGSLIPREIINSFGYMNEDFFIDYIDIEWSFRLQSRGYKLFACPNAKMFHQVGDGRVKVLGREISLHSPLRRYYLARNSLLMIRLKYINWRYKVREIFYTFTRVIVYLIIVKNRLKYLRYIANGFYDGILGRTGPYKK